MKSLRFIVCYATFAYINNSNNNNAKSVKRDTVRSAGHVQGAERDRAFAAPVNRGRRSEARQRERVVRDGHTPTGGLKVERVVGLQILHEPKPTGRSVLLRPCR